jgi:hypothetical protein
MNGDYTALYPRRPCRRYPYFDVVAGLAWSKYPESYADGSSAAGRVSLAGQVKGDDRDKKGYLGPLSWELGVGMTTCKTWICFETSAEVSGK